MKKSQTLSAILTAYNNIFPHGNRNFNNIIGKSDTTAYDDTALLCLYWDNDLLFINSVSKDDKKFPIMMLKDIISLAKKHEKVCLSTERKEEIRRLATHLGAVEIEIGYIKGVL